MKKMNAGITGKKVNIGVRYWRNVRDEEYLTPDDSHGGICAVFCECGRLMVEEWHSGLLPGCFSVYEVYPAFNGRR